MMSVLKRIVYTIYQPPPTSTWSLSERKRPMDPLKKRARGVGTAGSSRGGAEGASGGQEGLAALILPQVRACDLLSVIVS